MTAIITLIIGIAAIAIVALCALLKFDGVHIKKNIDIEVRAKK